MHTMVVIGVLALALINAGASCVMAMVSGFPGNHSYLAFYFWFATLASLVSCILLFSSGIPMATALLVVGGLSSIIGVLAARMAHSFDNRTTAYMLAGPSIAFAGAAVCLLITLGG